MGRNSIELAEEVFEAVPTAVLAKTIERLGVFDRELFIIPIVVAVTDDSYWVLIFDMLPCIIDEAASGWLTEEITELGNIDTELVPFVALVDINCDGKDFCGYSDIVVALYDDSVWALTFNVLPCTLGTTVDDLLTAESNRVGNIDMELVAFMALVEVTCIGCELSEMVLAFNDGPSWALTFDVLPCILGTTVDDLSTAESNRVGNIDTEFVAFMALVEVTCIGCELCEMVLAFNDDPSWALTFDVLPCILGTTVDDSLTAESNRVGNIDTELVAFMVLVDVNCIGCELGEIVLTFNDDPSWALTFDVLPCILGTTVDDLLTAESNRVGNIDTELVAFMALVDITCIGCELCEMVLAFNDDPSWALTFHVLPCILGITVDDWLTAESNGLGNIDTEFIALMAPVEVNCIGCELGEIVLAFNDGPSWALTFEVLPCILWATVDDLLTAEGIEFGNADMGLATVGFNEKADKLANIVENGSDTVIVMPLDGTITALRRLFFATMFGSVVATEMLLPTEEGEADIDSVDDNMDWYSEGEAKVLRVEEFSCMLDKWNDINAGLPESTAAEELITLVESWKIEFEWEGAGINEYKLDRVELLSTDLVV